MIFLPTAKIKSAKMQNPHHLYYVMLDCTVGYTALHHSVAWGHLGCSKALVYLGADPLLKTRHGETVIELGSRYKRTECVDYLDCVGEFNYTQPCALYSTTTLMYITLCKNYVACIISLGYVIYNNMLNIKHFSVKVSFCMHAYYGCKAVKKCRIQTIYGILRHVLYYYDAYIVPTSL